MYKFYSFLLLTLSLSACTGDQQDETTFPKIAESYVRLSLQIGQYNSDYVDAYYGPESWKPKPLTEEEKAEFPSDELIWKIHDLQRDLEDLNTTHVDDLEKAHQSFLIKQLIAAKTKVSIMAGTKLKFDDESKLLFDAVAPHYDSVYFDSLLLELDKLLPGKGTIQERYLQFSKEFIIPKEKLDTVFKTAIAEARRRTLEHIELPANENFELEYVNNKSWSGYNWYKGNFHSLIQINTDFPIYAERVIDLASHEGYPGHHVFNMLIEKNLVNKMKWKDFSIYPLFSPQSLIAEGSANFGIEMVFPFKDRIQFEKEVLFPLAGLDSSKAFLYNQIQRIKNRLNYAENEAARGYMDKTMSPNQAISWIMKYDLYSEERAKQRLRFINQYGSYVINYNLGKDIVANYVKKKGGNDSSKRWAAFIEVLSTPKTASMLQ